jgi:hypothetical protein
VCDKKAKYIIGLHTRCLVGRLERALTAEAILYFQIEFYRKDLIKGSIFNWPWLSAIDDS